jgi:hypothetical protein
VVSPKWPPLVYGARCGSRGSGSIPEGLLPRVQAVQRVVEKIVTIKGLI